MKGKTPFTDAKKQQELFQRLRDNNFKVVEERGMDDWPLARFRDFVDADALARLLEMLTWLMDEIRGASSDQTS